MPLPFENIYKQIKEKKLPDKLGEEGILHIVEARNTYYYAKQWYAIGEKRLGSPIEANASPASPYWHKLKYFEYNLIHKLFPQNTVAVVGSIDPRIGKDATFMHNTGRPITITQRVAGDIGQIVQRDNIIIRSTKRCTSTTEQRVTVTELHKRNAQHFIEPLAKPTKR